MIAGWESLQAALLLLSGQAREKGVAIGELAGILGVPPRRVTQWVERVSGAGDPEGCPTDLMELAIEGDRVRAYLGPHLTGPLRFAPEELVALLLLLSQVEQTAEGTPLAARARSIRTGLSDLGSDTAREAAQGVGGRVQVQVDEPTPILGLVQQALRERRKLEVVYFSEHSKSTKTYSVCPWACVQHAGHWYVVTENRHLLRVDRIHDATVLDESFEVPADFDVDALPRDVLFLGRADVAMELDTPAGPRTVLTASPEQVKDWVRSLHGEVVLRAPAEHRQSLLDECRALLARYEGPSGPLRATSINGTPEATTATPTKAPRPV